MVRQGMKSDYEQEMESTPLYDYDREMKAFKGVPIDSRWQKKEIHEILDSAPFLLFMGAMMAIAFWMGVLAYRGYFDEPPTPVLKGVEEVEDVSPPTPMNFRRVQ